MKKRQPLNKKDQRPDSAKLNPLADLFPEEKQNASLSTQHVQFTGTDNPRHLRAIRLLMIHPVKREELDNVAGCSNGPELVAELRRRGLEIPCTRIARLDRDGRECRPGIYHLTDKDRRILAKWLRNRRRS